jgi:hypothetical protein
MRWDSSRAFEEGFILLGVLPTVMTVTAQTPAMVDFLEVTPFGTGRRGSSEAEQLIRNQ